MLNETWLKKVEVFPVDVYKVFRLHRSSKTHPIDPNDQNKFRKNGGGVLNAIRRDMDIVSTRLEFQCAGEILGVTLKFNDGRQLVLCTYYRVDSLGIDNHNEFKSFIIIKKARSRRGVIDIIVAGDLKQYRRHRSTFS